MENAPTVLAVYHPHWFWKVPFEGLRLRYAGWKITRLFNKVARDGVKRRLFIESPPSNVAFTGKPSEFSTFYHAIAEARRHGWEVIALDSESVIRKLQVWDVNRPTDDVYAYLHSEREKSWTKKLENHGEAGHDFVLIHPDHVAGFLESSGIPKERVVWVNKPTGQFVRPLSKEYLAIFNRDRMRDRVRRRRRRKPG